MSVLGTTLGFMAWPQRGRYSPRKSSKRLPEKQRQRILHRYPHCQLCIIGICTVKSVEVHHVWDVADGGPDTDYLPDGTRQLVGVCRECHRHVSARNSAARANAARNRQIADTEPPPASPFRSYSEMSRWI